jgi:preprotein translocase subunit SecD
MMRLPQWKVILCLLALAYGIVFSLPNVLPPSVLATIPSWVPMKKLNLGLDLRGGSRLLYEVDVAALKKERLTNLVEDVRTTLSQKQLPFAELANTGNEVTLRVVDPGQLDQAVKELSTLGQPLPTGGGRDVSIQRQDGQRIRLFISDQAMAQEASQAVAQDMEIVRRRIDEMGTREVSITRQGSNRIVVEAPGESDPEKLQAIIGRTAKLTFQMMDETVSPEEVQSGRAPPGTMIVPTETPNEPFIAVKRRVLVSGEMLVHAGTSTDDYGQPDITFRFNGQGARRFAEATSRNIGKRFAILLDGKSISSPTIQSAILGGSGIITGNFTPEEASNLALLLRSGALPAPLKIQEKREVGAELGADAIRAGQISLSIGVVAIFVFIVGAYGLFGLFSATAVLVNGLMLIATLSLVQATLTLPGIAGIVLTLAVAIDANVLIYERMRDEARAGRSFLSSLEHGYSLAYPSIIDANLTSLISAIIMMSMGSGPVKGFAWTLMVGVVTSVFTAILVTQVMIGLWTRWARPKKLPI